MNFKYYSLTLLIAYVSLVVLAFSMPLYFETGNDVFSKMISSGAFTGSPEGVLSSYGSAVLISDFYAFLYRIVPNVPWFDLFNLFFVSVILAHVWLIILPFIYQRNWAGKIFAIGVILILVQNVFLSEPTRVGLLLSGTSLILLYTRRVSGAPVKIILHLFVLAGILVRVEAGILALVMIQLVGFLYSSHRKKFLVKNSPLYLSVIILLIFINIPRNDAEWRYLSIRPYQFSLWDFYPEHKNLILDNNADSIKLLTSKQFFLADEQALSKEFFDRIGVLGVDKTPTYLLNYFQSLDIQSDKFKNYAELYLRNECFFILLWILVFCLATVGNGNRNKALMVLLSGIGALIVLAFFMKMEERLFYPLICLNMMTLIAFNSESMSRIKSKIWNPWVFILFFLISIFLLVKNTSPFYQQKRIVDKELSAIRSEIAVLPDSSIIFFNLTPLVHWDGKYFERTKLSARHIYVPYDNGLLFTQPENRKFLIKTFGCHAFECVTKTAFSNKSTYFVSDLPRLELIRKYLRVIYNITFSIEMVNTHPMYGTDTDQSFELYRVKEITFLN